MTSYDVEEVITALYQAALGRNPDQHGLEYYSGSVRSGKSELHEVARSLFDSDEHLLRVAGPSKLRDYTQFGELAHLLRLLVCTGSEFQTIVDVGARGRERSNSYNLLADFGWKGLLIDANPELGKLIHSEFHGLQYRFINCAVSDASGTMPFYIGINDDVSSLSAEHAAIWGDIRGSISVEVKRLSDLLRENQIPLTFDVLSLDIEGHDVRVFNDLIANSEFRPTIVLIEASYDFHCKTLEQAGLSAAVTSMYELVAQTSANMILRRI